MKHRDGNIDLMRLIFMFFICLIHAVGYVDARWTHWLANISYVGVAGFVLISGFYGIRFSVSKVLRLEMYAMVCAATVVFLSRIAGMSNIGDTLSVFKSYWFVHAYVLMMCFSTLVEKLIDVYKKGLVSEREIVLAVVPVLLMVFVWSFSMRIWGLQQYIPRAEGINTPFSGIALFAIYIVGAMCRLFNIEKRMNIWVAVLIILVCAPIVAWPIFCGCFARYDSAFVLMLSFALFAMFRRIHIAPYIGKVSSWLAPSVLAVYLYHCNPYGYRLFGFLERILSENGFPMYCIFFVVAFFAMIGGLMLDLPRRGLCILLSKPIEAVSKLFDSAVASVIVKIVR